MKVTRTVQIVQAKKNPAKQVAVENESEMQFPLCIAMSIRCLR